MLLLLLPLFIFVFLFFCCWFFFFLMFLLFFYNNWIPSIIKYDNGNISVKYNNNNIINETHKLTFPMVKICNHSSLVDIVSSNQCTTQFFINNSSVTSQYVKDVIIYIKLLLKLKLWQMLLSLFVLPFSSFFVLGIQ